MKIVQNQLLKIFDIQSLEKGEFACWVSHATLWQKLAQIKNSCTFWTIYEDDAQFGKTFTENYPSGQDFMTHNIDKPIMLYMGGFWNRMSKITDGTCVDVPSQKVCKGLRNLVLHAYSLTSSMATQLVQDLFQDEPRKYWPVDGYLYNFFKQNPDMCQCMNPLISQSVPGWKTDIHTLSNKIFRFQREKEIQIN